MSPLALRRGPALLLGLALLALVGLAQASETLRVTRPKEFRAQFTSGEGGEGSMYAEPSLFGKPNYQADIMGLLRMDSAADNAQGCKPYADDFNPFVDDEDDKPKVIALVARGGCSFGTKALMAQAAHASAIIVYSDSDLVPLPKMAGGEDTYDIRIPGFLVTLSDGLKLKDGAEAAAKAKAEDDKASAYYSGAWASLSYTIVAADVKFDLFTYPDEVNAQQFVKEFGEVADQLGPSATFTPRYRIIDGATHGCLSIDGQCKEDSLPCGNQCTNCGRYCRLDPNGDLEREPDGRDQVEESARAKCVWKLGQEQGRLNLWWDYSNERAITLRCIHQKPYKGKQCSEEAMRLVGISDADIVKITKCMGTTMYDLDAENPLLEEELEWARVWQPLTSPFLFVNNFTYFGGFSCPGPATPGTCGPLSMICQGFLPGMAPPVCGFVPDGCEPGVKRDACGVCGGTETDKNNCKKESKTGFPIGPVIGVVIVSCVLIGGAVYWYMRRQNNRMKDDIDSLLKQYLPLDGASSSSNGKLMGSSPSVRDNSSNLRLIGHLDSADEPTDL